MYKGKNGRYYQTLEERFWTKVNKKGDDECWEWQACRNSDGYGSIGYKKSTALAHRVSWELHFGPIPEGMQVLHKCDNPPCMNPNHFFLGTHTDNMRDRKAKGRANYSNNAKGEKNGAAKLTCSDVIAIRKDTRTHKAIAKDYGVDFNTIYRVKARKLWGHIGNQETTGHGGNVPEMV